MERIGKAALRLLRRLDARDASNEASGGLERPDQFQEKMPERSGRRTDNAQRSGKDRRGEEVATDHAAAVKGSSVMGIGCGQVGFQISCRDALEGKAAIAIACPPPSGDTIDGNSRCRANNVRWISEYQRMSGSPRPLVAPAGIVVPFRPAGEVRRMEW